jgi:hypothetical protein
VVVAPAPLNVNTQSVNSGAGALVVATVVAAVLAVTDVSAANAEVASNKAQNTPTTNLLIFFIVFFLWFVLASLEMGRLISGDIMPEADSCVK